jgi:DNA-binding MarR family transcriptional regulator
MSLRLASLQPVSELMCHPTSDELIRQLNAVGSSGVNRAQQPFSDREQTAWRAFYELQEVLRGRIEQHLQADSGLSHADYTVLAVLSEADSHRLRAIELGQRLGWEKSRLHHQLTRMCKRGLVRRSSGEGRAVNVTITSAGLSALEAAIPFHRQHVRHLVLERISPEQLDELGAISRTLLDGLQRSGGSKRAVTSPETDA